MTLLEMSLYGAILIVLILALRPFAKRFLPKRTLVALWWVALVRLLVPFEIPWRFSAYTAIERAVPARGAALRSSDIADTIARNIAPALNATAAAPTPPALRATSPFRGGQTLAGTAPAFASNGWILPAIYIFGLLLTLGFFVYSYVRLNTMLKSARPVADERIRPDDFRLRRNVRIMSCANITSPFTFGLIKPVIVLPKGLLPRDAKDVRAVVCHELIHIKHFDAPLKALVAICCCIHWFNPLCWIMAKAYARDTELACDAAVLREVGREGRSSYATTLLSLQSRETGLLTGGFSRLAIKERIVWIMKYRRLPLASTAMAAALVVLMAAAFATSSEEIARVVKAVVTTKPYPANTYQIGWNDSFHPLSMDIGDDGKVLLSGYTDAKSGKMGMLQTLAVRGDEAGDTGWDWLEVSRDAIELDDYSLMPSSYIDAKFVDGETIAALRSIPNRYNEYSAMLIKVETDAGAEIMKADCLSKEELGIYPVPGGLLLNGKPDDLSVRITKMSMTGDVLWQKVLPEPITFNGILTRDGVHLAYGRNGGENGAAVIIAFDDMGNILWRYDGAAVGEFTSAILTGEGIVLAGYDPDAFEGRARGIIMSFDMSGREIFAGEYFYQDETGFQDAVFNSICQTPEGYMACVNNAEAHLLRLVKFDKQGGIISEANLDISSVTGMYDSSIARVEGAWLISVEGEVSIIFHGWANYNNELGKPAYITVLALLPSKTITNIYGEVLYEAL